MVAITRTSTTDGNFILLEAMLDEELLERYGDIQLLYQPYNKIGRVETAIVVFHDNEPIGCGCIKHRDDDTAEIKRMFIKKEYRGKGISKKILSELERWAIQLGYNNAVLETGLLQPESIALYTRMDYEPIPNYESYMEKVQSLCFGKAL